MKVDFQARKKVRVCRKYDKNEVNANSKAKDIKVWIANYKIRYIKSIKEKHGRAIVVCMIAIIVLQEHRIAMVYAQWCNMHEWSYI